MQRTGNSKRASGWAVFGLIVLAVVIMAIIPSQAGVRQLATVLLLLLVALFVNVLVHELGHYVAARREGYPIYALVVGPFGFYRTEDGGWAFQIRGKWPSVLGYCLFGTKVAMNQRWGYARAIAGGPLAGFLFAALSYWAALWLQGAFPVPDYAQNPVLWMLNTFAFMVPLVSLSLNLTALLPTEWADTDGHKLFRLLRSDAHARRYLALEGVRLTNVRGVRPRDWEPEWIAMITELQDRSVDTVTAHKFAYRWALDRGDQVAAEAYLAQAVKWRESANPRERATVLVEAAFFECRYHANQQNAQEWVQKLGLQRRLAAPLPRYRWACAYGLVLGKYDEVRRLGKALLQGPQPTGMSQQDADLVQEMLDLCDLADEMKAQRNAGKSETPPPPASPSSVTRGSDQPA